MKVLIIEDETAAAKNLIGLIKKVDPAIEVLDVVETITDSLDWLRNNDAPDLIFMDIHLADGSAFNIFDHADITAPVVFTTAYDRYALEAFAVNSIDYLLKPIKPEDLLRALEKFKRFTNVEKAEYVERTKERFAIKIQSLLIAVRDRLIPLSVEDIAYFYTSQEKVVAVNFEGKTFPADKTLDQLNSMLDENMFFRANRQFIISRRAVRDMSVWFGSRLSVNLKVEAPEKIVISKVRVKEFKNWIAGGC